MAIKYNELEKAFKELKEKLNKAEDEACAHCGKELGDKTDIYRDGKNAFCSDTHMSQYDPEPAKPAPKPLTKDVNTSYSPAPNATMGTSGGQGGMYKQGVAPMADAMAMSEEVIKFDKNGQWSLDKSAFKTLQHKIERQGHSKDSAAAITASIGRKEIGQKEMTARSKAGMDKSQVPGSKYPSAANNPDKKPMLRSGVSPAALKVLKVDPEENVNIPHPQGKAKMANGVNKEENMKDGTNQRLANPPEKAMSDPRGRVHMVKEEGTNEEAASSKPHNKGKFKVEDPVKEKSVEHAKTKGLPYNGEDKKIHKADKVLVGTGTNDENKSPGRNSGHGAL